jgi:hypothetical protein
MSPAIRDNPAEVSKVAEDALNIQTTDYDLWFVPTGARLYLVCSLSKVLDEFVHRHELTAL